MSNLNIQSNDFSGNEQICIGDGSGLKITHTGTASLSTSFSSFVLNNILVLPQSTKNLLSVQKFAQDNNVYFEFHNVFFFH
jgi:histone deacetylase 1/2